jgi:hypothetical protein
MKIIHVAVFLLLLGLFASVCASETKTWAPGVAVGDYFTYDMYGVYANQSNLAIPEFEYNNTAWTRINITKIESLVVYQIYTLHFVNGSETSFSFHCDVNPANKSSLMFNQKGVPLCAANLTVGDTVPTDETTIDETLNRPYASGFRETNHAFWNSSTDWGDIYFDRQTGMLVELHRTHRFAGNSSEEIVDKTDVIIITDTNRWQVTAVEQQPFTPLFIALTIGIFALLVFIVLISRFVTRKTRNRQLCRHAANYK